MPHQDGAGQTRSDIDTALVGTHHAACLPEKSPLSEEDSFMASIKGRTTAPSTCHPASNRLLSPPVLTTLSQYHFTMSLGTIISFIGTGISLLSFVDSNFPDPQESGSVTAFSVGLDTDGLSDAGGDLPDIRLWDEAGQFLGATYDPGSINSGAAGQQVKISHDSGFEFSQSTYALLTANNDAICIAYVSHTWADGNKWAWSGDWGSACDGGTFYHSNIIINSEEPHKPDCLWIDADGDQPVKGVQIHFPDFTSNEPGVKPDFGKEFICDTPAYRYSFNNDPNEVVYFDPPRDYNNYGNNKKRTASRPAIRTPQKPTNATANAPKQKIPPTGRVYSTDSRLVVSSDAQHTASSLCEADRSYGPDFVSLVEGLYCDMSTKTLAPLCGEGVEDDCFDVEAKEMRASFQAKTAPKKFSKVMAWD